MNGPRNSFSIHETCISYTMDSGFIKEGRLRKIQSWSIWRHITLVLCCLLHTISVWSEKNTSSLSADWLWYLNSQPLHKAPFFIWQGVEKIIFCRLFKNIRMQGLRSLWHLLAGNLKEWGVLFKKPQWRMIRTTKQTGVFQQPAKTVKTTRDSSPWHSAQRGHSKRDVPVPEHESALILTHNRTCFIFSPSQSRSQPLISKTALIILAARVQ